MPFFLHERALYALLAVSPVDERRLLTAIEQIEAMPMQCVDGSRTTPAGRVENVCIVRGFLICFSINPDGSIYIHDILKS
jgi:hypothetical protein